ncbi:DNA-binding SARP family transcriptional activator [Crossiella equi]|uniref:DNA-binding SARP family transcriptional activator n=1 Tax=Crossiella equi TaxID=130796 RepID=A0ABS5AJN1_9PSEU|nr:AfsR/SARP family transcriptional regulator [Crossiella equi]MBP2476780.1 DNA-binding SARP family transcriptional activator [Crossiella equi]
MRSATDAIRLGGAIPVSLLGQLLAQPNQVVSTARLAGDIWPGQDTDRVVGSLYAHLSRLRRALGEKARISAESGGYRIRVEPGELDSSNFYARVTEARVLVRAGLRAEASAVLGEALELWRGPAFVGLRGETLEREAARLDELRRVAVQERADLELALGRGADLVFDLRELVDERPFDEALRARLMSALWQAGRSVEALTAFREARTRFVAELGVEPGPKLQEVHRRILLSEFDGILTEMGDYCLLCGRRS